MKEEEMMDIADYLHRTPEAREDAAAVAKIREECMRSAGNSRCRFDAMRVEELSVPRR